MKLRFAALSLALALGVAHLVAAVHEYTYKGTVLSVSVKALKVKVLDEKTKKNIEMPFELDKETRILRGDKVVTFDEAKIQIGEKIAVTINSDDSETLANIVRLDVKK